MNFPICINNFQLSTFIFSIIINVNKNYRLTIQITKSGEYSKITHYRFKNIFDITQKV